jgi:hypothetical protein
MNAAHTPGPWLVANNGKNGKKTPTFRVWRTDPNQPKGDDFGNIGYACIAPHVGGEANARLIAASPELLEALETLVQRVSDLGTNGFSQEVAKGKAAIAKAKGGQGE